MSTKVILPKLGLTMEEGTILSWLKREGEQVVQGEPLFEIETDKVQMVVEAPASGILRGVLVKSGATVPVGQVIAVITRQGESIEEPLPPVAASGSPAAAPAAQAAVQAGSPDQQRPSEAQAGPGAGTPKASPAAKKLAREHGVNLSGLTGSGPGGRIIEEDVRRAIENHGR